MLFKYSGKYVNIYFNMKITYHKAPYKTARVRDDIEGKVKATCCFDDPIYEK